MEFTYEAFKELIKALKQNDYTFCNYHNHKQIYDNGKNKVVIMRHDVDNSLHKAAKLAEAEAEMEVASTYFLLLSTDSYNMASKNSRELIDRIINAGHNIGLHFDEVRYGFDAATEEGRKKISEMIKKEAHIMETILDGYKIRSVSMHRPSKAILGANLDTGNIVNSYSTEFFRVYKYLSDSRMNWREDVMSIIKAGEYDKIHILTHAFWYSRYQKNIKDVIVSYLNDASEERKKELSENMRDLESILS